MVLVLDDHPIARQGLESIIKLHKPEEETLQAGTVGEAIDLVEHKPVDLWICIYIMRADLNFWSGYKDMIKL